MKMLKFEDYLKKPFVENMTDAQPADANSAASPPTSDVEGQANLTEKDKSDLVNLGMEIIRVAQSSSDGGTNVAHKLRSLGVKSDVVNLAKRIKGSQSAPQAVPDPNMPNSQVTPPATDMGGATQQNLGQGM